MTVITPCRGRGPVYDTALSRTAPIEERREARRIAAGLCAGCPIADTCTDRVTIPAPHRRRKAPTVTTETNTAPAAPPAAASVPAAAVPAPQLVAASTSTPATPDELIAWGAADPTTRLQALAARARAALTDLRHESEKQAAVADAEARIARLKAQLANAEQDLKAAKSPGTATQAKASGDRPSREESTKIRAWAREHGYGVAPAGIIARTVIDAYRAAHPKPNAA